jgi:hypothetical protein
MAKISAKISAKILVAGGWRRSLFPASAAALLSLVPCAAPAQQTGVNFPDGPGDIVRNMDADRNGNPVIANSLVNKVGVVEIGGTTH